MAEQAARRLLSTASAGNRGSIHDFFSASIFDAIRVKIRDEGFVRNKAIYIALGILADGTKEILGIWIEQTEGAKFWLRVMNELKNRGVGDILIAVVDGLKGFPEAINAVFPQTVVQTCIVHLIRHSLEFVSWKDRKTVMPALRAIYRARDAEAGMKALEEFEAGYWGQRYPAITQSWRRNWDHVVPFFVFPESVRRIIYTTDEIDKRLVVDLSFVGAGDLVAKRGALAASTARPPYSSLAGLRRPRALSLGGRGRQTSTKCS